MNDTTQASLRQLLTLAAGGLITKGVTDSHGLEIAVGAIVTLAAFVWGVIHRKQLLNTEPPR